MRPLRIGINALYMIPGGVGGTEIYLRSLLLAFARLKTPHHFFVFVNSETRDSLAPPSSQFEIIHTGVRASNRPWRLAWEQVALPSALRKHHIDVLLNPGFTAPVLSPCPSVMRWPLIFSSTEKILQWSGPVSFTRQYSAGGQRKACRRS